MKKVVIFDWGGIVESHENNMADLLNARIRTIKRFNPSLSSQEALRLWTNITPRDKNAGTINDSEEIKEWLDLIKKNLKIHVSNEELVKAYEEEGTKIKYYKDVVSFAHSLKNRCEIAILSNLLPIDKKRINDQYDLRKFDHVYLSFELGLRKSDLLIYKYVLNDLQVEVENILFIDDNHENIIAAQKCGWNTCEAFGYELDKIKGAVEEFLKQG